MTNKENIIRKKIIESALDLDKKGLNQCKAGNISVRWKKGMLITPSGMEYNKLRPEDIVYVENNFKAHGKRKPSIETPFHIVVPGGKTAIRIGDELNINLDNEKIHLFDQQTKKRIN